MVIVDSTVWIDYLAGTANPHTRWLFAEFGRADIGLTDLILCEVLQGAREREFARAHARLDSFEIFDTGGEHLALAAATNYGAIRRRGITVRSTIDCIVATFCLQEGYSLLHRDRDYDAFEEHLDLQVVHPPASLRH